MIYARKILKTLTLLSLPFMIGLGEVSAATCAGDSFDAAAYLARYKDLRDAGINLGTACNHYELYGKNEGRNAKPDGSSTPSDDSCDLEVKSYTIKGTNLTVEFQSAPDALGPFDVEIVGSNKKWTWSDIVLSQDKKLRLFNVKKQDSAELKIISIVDPQCFAEAHLDPNAVSGTILCKGEVFDPVLYIARYKDLRDLGLQVKNACEHYKIIGKGQGRSGTPDVVVIPTEPVLAACKAGPEIKSISNVTATGLSTLFHGEEIYGIDYEIKNSSSSKVASGSFVPTSNTPQISYAALPAGNYTLSFAGNKCRGGSSKAFSITGPVIVDPGLPACKAGPEIKAISNVTKTGLSAQFNGEEIYGIDYEIKNSSSVKVASGSFVPTSNTPQISYSALPAGDYTLSFAGNKCKGGSSKAFSIISDEPPVILLPVCKEGPEIKTISNISQTGVSVLFNGVEIYGIDYEIKNGSNVKVASGAFVPKSNTPEISFPALLAGSYTLSFKGTFCQGGSSKTFVIEPSGSGNKKILFIGNSMTGHGPAANLGWNGDWGMAASSKDKDYVHLVAKDLGLSESDIMTSNSGGYLEGDVDFNYDLNNYGPSKDFRPDVIVVRIGENAIAFNQAGTRGILKQKIQRLVNYLKNGRNVKLVISTTFWRESNYTDVNIALRESANELSASLVELSDLHDQAGMTAAGLFENPGVADHPSDKGMKAIADRILVGIKSTGIPNESSSYDDASLAQSDLFGEQSAYSESQLQEKEGVYASKANYAGETKNLKYAFVSPSVSSAKKRPFVLMVHEGAFLFGDLGAEIGMARLMAQKGYATAAINYRLGFDGASEGNACGGNSQGVVRALYRAVQDARSALSYFSSKAGEFGIDKNQFFLEGSSAGSMTIAALAYMTEADFLALDANIVKDLGSLNPGGVDYKIRSLLTRTGYSVLGTQYMTAANALPTAFFQSAQDNVLPYQSGTLYYCGHYPQVFGAGAASAKLKELQKPFDLTYEPSPMHLLDYPQSYIADHYSKFIKRIWSQDSRQVTYNDYVLVEDSSTPSGGLPACKAGPEIKSISGITKTSLNALYHGEDIYGIDYSILSLTGAKVASGSFVPQNNAPQISYPELAAGNYTLVFRGNKCEGGSSQAFTIAAVEVPGENGGTTGSPGGGLSACKAGPQITNISNLSSNGLTIQFHGEDIYGLDYNITNSGGSVVASGSFVPKNNVPDISFSTLGEGTYNLILKGNTCSGQSSRSFYIAGNSGGGTTVPSTGSSCTTTNTTNFTESIKDGCDENQRVSKTLMFISTGSEVWSDTIGAVDLLKANRGAHKPRVPSLNAKLLDLPEMRYAMDEWEKLGGTSISIYLGWGFTQVSDDRYVWEPLDWVLDYAACKKMKVVLKVGTDADGPYHTPEYYTPDWCTPNESNKDWCTQHTPADRAYRYLEADEARGQDGQLTQDRVLSYASPKWKTNVGKWLNKVAERVVQRGRVNTVQYAIMTSTDAHEFEYTHEGDYTPRNVEAWREWQINRYGSVKYENMPGGISSEGAGKDMFIFRTEQLQKTYKLLNEAFQPRGMKTIYDSGSFTDLDGRRNVWGVPFAANEFGFNGMKQNPGDDYAPNLQAKLLSCTGKFSSVEWTYQQKDHNLSGENYDYATRMADRFSNSVDNGVNDISFAFIQPSATVSPDNSSPTVYRMDPLLVHMVNRMKQTGHWDRKQQCFNGNTYVDIQLSQVLKNGRNEYKSGELDQAINQKGNRGVCTRLFDDINLNLK